MDSNTLIRMANQIARNLAPQGEDAAVAQTVQHIRDFWDPRMKAALVGGEGEGLEPLALKALQQLRGQS